MTSARPTVTSAAATAMIMSANTVPVFGPGGDVVAAIELAVADLGRDLQPVTAALSVASRSLSRELATEPRRRMSAVPSPTHV